MTTGFPHDPRDLGPRPTSFPPPYATTPPERPRSRLRRVAGRLGRGLLYLLVGYWLLAVVLLGVYRFVNPPVTGVQLERRIEARLAGKPYTMRRRRVDIDRLPAHVPRAVAAAEDGNFWKHWGFDLKELRRAGEEALDGERPRGASTITQQLVKNLFGCTCRNPVRKLFDFALTVPAEVLLGKKRIMELYLNEVEWGPNGIFGIEEGARRHYGVSARQLTRTQAAGLAALLPNPLRRTPRNTAAYRGMILRRMNARGW